LGKSNEFCIRNGSCSGYRRSSFLKVHAWIRSINRDSDAIYWFVNWSWFCTFQPLNRLMIDRWTLVYPELANGVKGYTKAKSESWNYHDAQGLLSQKLDAMLKMLKLMEVWLT
jgi:hypothetical protein